MKFQRSLALKDKWDNRFDVTVFSGGEGEPMLMFHVGGASSFTVSMTEPSFAELVAVMQQAKESADAERAGGSS